MTKVKPNNRNKSKSEIFAWEIFKSDIIFDCLTFIIGTFQFHCKNEQKQVK